MDRHEEFKELHRKFQHLEQNRKAYVKESSKAISRQQKLIDKLRKDNEYLKNQYKNLSRKPRDSISHTQMLDLNEQVDIYAEKVTLEKERVAELSKHTKLMKRKLLQVRKEMGGVNAAKESHRMVQKQMHILENRLDKALVKFNKVLSENKDLRKKIDDLRKERHVFDEIRKKLEDELNLKKSQMADIIESSNQAYEIRDQARRDISDIERQNDIEQASHNDMIMELDRLHDKIMDNRDRGRDLTMTLAQIGVSQEDQKEKDGEEDEEDNSIRAQAARAASLARKEQRALELTKRKVASFENAFEQIKRNVGITDINKFVKTFIESEDQNFSLFNYANEQTREIHKLEDEIAKSKEEEKKYQDTHSASDDQHQQLVRELQEKLDSTNDSAEKFETKYVKSSKTLSSLKIGIQNIFHKIKCDEETMSDMLSGQKVVVNDANIMKFLGMIEQRTNEILQLSAIASVEGDDGEVVVEKKSLIEIIGPGPNYPVGDQKMQVTLPTMDEYTDGEETDDGDNSKLPQNLDQIKKDVMKYMSERKSGNGGSEYMTSGHNGSKTSDARPKRGRRGRLRRAF